MNYCHNKLYVSGSWEDIHDLAKQLSSGNKKESNYVFCLSGILPIPKKVLRNSSKAKSEIMYANMFQWCRFVRGYFLRRSKKHESAGSKIWSIKKWGTCSDVMNMEKQEISITKEGSCLFWHFHTAWSPPTKWLEFVASKYPNLYFKLDYFDFASDYSGCSIGYNGIIEDSYHDLLSQEEIKEWSD